MDYICEEEDRQKSNHTDLQPSGLVEEVSMKSNADTYHKTKQIKSKVILQAINRIEGEDQPK